MTLLNDLLIRQPPICPVKRLFLQGFVQYKEKCYSQKKGETTLLQKEKIISAKLCSLRKV